MWAITGMAAAQRGDINNLVELIENYETEYCKGKERKYPLYTGEVGWICMECEKLYELYERKIKTAFIPCIWFCAEWIVSPTQSTWIAFPGLCWIRMVALVTRAHIFKNRVHCTLNMDCSSPSNGPLPQGNVWNAHQIAGQQLIEWFCFRTALLVGCPAIFLAFR